MALLVESGKYGAINTTDTTSNGFYVIMFTSDHIHYMITQQLMDKL